jgi:uncharacterized protein (DUF2267 family)
MPQDLAVLDTTVQKTHSWIKEVTEEAGWDDKHKGYLALRAVLHALRDRLTVDEAANLSAQLPMLVRGIYFEGWRPAETPVKQRSRDEFLQSVSEHFPDTGDDIDPAGTFKAVFRASPATSPLAR